MSRHVHRDVHALQPGPHEGEAGPDVVLGSTAAGGAAAAFADVAGAGGAHLGAAGEAERGVDGGAGDLLQELGGGVGLLHLGLGDLALVAALRVVVSRRLLRNLLNHRG